MLSILLPVRCAICRRLGDVLCELCRTTFLGLGPTGCDRCGAPGPWPIARCVECTGRRLAFAHARAAIVYDDRARLFVRAWKEHGRRDLAPIAAGMIVEVISRAPAPIVTFVPAEADRRLERGHAPPERLAEALSARWAVPVTPLLRRRRRGGLRRSGRQSGRTLADRRANVRGAYASVSACPPAVCLVDDVYTSGSTANACASALRRAGARRVEVVTLARAVR